MVLLIGECETKIDFSVAFHFQARKWNWTHSLMGFHPLQVLDQWSPFVTFETGDCNVLAVFIVPITELVLFTDEICEC